MEKSNLDVAYDIMLKSEGPMTFKDLWNEVCTIQNYSEEEARARIAKFYTNLFMDCRFVTLGENTWDLRDGYKYDDVRIDEKVIYHDDDNDSSASIDEDEDEEEDIFDDEEEDEEEDFDEFN